MRKLTWILLGALLAVAIGATAATGGKLGIQLFTLVDALSGERNEDSTTGTDYLSTSTECGMSAEINLATDASTTVYPGPAILCGYTLSVTVGTAAATIDDNATAKMTLPVSWPVGYYGPMGAIFETSLVVNPADTSTGTLQLYYRPLDAGNTWVP